MNNYTIHILIGLPGSGKTFFSKTFNKDNTYIIELDVNDTNFLYGYRYNMESYKNVCIDGLILSKRSLLEAINQIDKTFKNKQYEIVLHYWHENREQCLINDEYRKQVLKERDTNARVTIKSSPFISYDEVVVITQEHNKNIRLVEHIVYPLSDNDKIINKVIEFDNKGFKVIKSKDWCLGGTSCDYTGKKYLIDAEPQPEFDKFDDLLLELCPDISYLKYKKLFRECVEIKTWDESDYYGGRLLYSYYECDVIKLLQKLDKMNLI